MNITCFCNAQLTNVWNPNATSLACPNKHSFVNLYDNTIIRYDLFIPSLNTNSSRKIVSYHNNTTIFLYKLEQKLNSISKILFHSNLFFPLPIKNNIIQITPFDKLIKLNAFS